jgi:protein-S-isoprenylcysteine O-methyltransferase Ste14
MFTGIYQSIATLAIVAVFYIIDVAMMSRYERKLEAAGSRRNWDFTRFMVTASILLVLQPITFPAMSLIIAANWGLGLQITGIIVVIFAFSFHIWARIHLKKFYDTRDPVVPRHRLLTAGPYQYVRYPILTSFFGITTSILLINPSLITLLIAIYTSWNLSKTALQDERLMNSTLPEYPAYMERTPRFLPRLWKNK